MSKNKKVLVTIGDSWTFGENLEEGQYIETCPDPIKEAFRKKNVYGEKLKQQLGFSEHKSFSLSGASHKHLEEFTYEAVAKYKDTDCLFVIGLTSPFRKRFFLNKLNQSVDISYASGSDPNEFYALSILEKLSKSEKREIRKHLLDTFDKEHLVKETFYHILNIQNLLKVNGINYVIFNCFTDYEDCIPDISNLIDKTKFYNYPQCILKDFPDNENAVAHTNIKIAPYHSKFLASCGHPNVQGHEVIATLLSQFIRKNIIL